MKRVVAFLRRRWLLLLILVGFLIFVIIQGRDIEALGVTLVRGQWEWLLVATGVQALYYFLYAIQYEFGFATVEVQSNWVDLVPVVFASIFVTTVVPSGGVSSLALFVDDAARRGQSPVRAAEGSLLVLVADLATMVPLIAYAMLYLAERGVLEIYQMLGVALYVAFSASLAGVILLGRWLPGVLHAAFVWAQENINWLASLAGRPPLLPLGWADRQAKDYIEAARHISDHPRALGWTLAIAFVVHLVGALTLFFIFLAYGQPASPGAVISAFVFDVVFSVVAFVPQGLGIAESVIALVLISLGIPVGAALAITVVFRGFSVWLPLLIGFLLLRQVRTFGGKGPSRGG